MDNKDFMRNQRNIHCQDHNKYYFKKIILNF